jgi:hypothetical protein
MRIADFYRIIIDSIFKGISCTAQFGFELAQFFLWLLIEFSKDFPSRFREINFDFRSSLYVLVN